MTGPEQKDTGESIQRGDVFAQLEEITEQAIQAAPQSGANGERVQMRLKAIKDNIRSQGNWKNPVNHKQVDKEKAKDLETHHKVLLSMQAGGEMESPEGTDSSCLSDLRKNACFSRIPFRDEKPRWQIDLEEAISLNVTTDIPTDTTTKRTYKIGETGASIFTELSGLREGSFGPAGLGVDKELDKLLSQEPQAVKYYCSAKLRQMDNPFVFPSSDKIQNSKLVDRFGEKSYRSSDAADASVILVEPGHIIGHWSGVSGAAFGQLMEVNDKGEVTKHGHMFLGPNNVYGSEESVIKRTIEECGFDLTRTHLVVEHQEGTIYARNDLLNRENKLVKEIRKRYGDEILMQIIPALADNPGKKAFSLEPERTGQAVFNIAESVKMEAILVCGLPEKNIHINYTCPSTDPRNKHYSTITESTLIPSKGFIAPDSELPPKILQMFLRNLYRTFIVNP